MDPKTQNAFPVLSHPQTAILYQNPGKTVTLLDIPQSISLSQLEEIKENCKQKGDWCLPRLLSKALLESNRREVKRSLLGYENRVMVRLFAWV